MVEHLADASPDQRLQSRVAANVVAMIDSLAADSTERRDMLRMATDGLSVRESTYLFGSRVDSAEIRRAKRSAPHEAPGTRHIHNQLHHEDIEAIKKFWHDNCEPIFPSQRATIQLERYNNASRVTKLVQCLSNRVMHRRYREERKKAGKRALGRTMFIKYR